MELHYEYLLQFQTVRVQGKIADQAKEILAKKKWDN